MATEPTSQAVERKEEGSVFWGMVWMIVLSLLLFWLPTFGPLLAGMAGGKRAGGVGPGLLAALLPALLLSAALAAFATALSGLPLIGAVAGMGVLVLVVLETGPLLIGAAIGGLFAR